MLQTVSQRAVWLNHDTNLFDFFYSVRSCLQVVEDPGANTLGGGADEGTFVEAINPNAPNIKVDRSLSQSI